jgi:hypothetical protein
MILAGPPDLIRVFLDAGMLNSILQLNRQKCWISQIFPLSKLCPRTHGWCANRLNGSCAKLWVRRAIFRHRVTKIRQGHMVVEQIEKIFSLIFAVAVDGIEHVFGCTDTHVKIGE